MPVPESKGFHFLAGVTATAELYNDIFCEDEDIKLWCLPEEMAEVFRAEVIHVCNADSDTVTCIHEFLCPLTLTNTGLASVIDWVDSLRLCGNGSVSCRTPVEMKVVE